MKDWKACRLGDVVKVEQGLAINSKSNHLIVDEGWPLLRITDLINNTKTQYIDEHKVARKFITKPSDLIYTRTGQVGLVFKGRIGVIHNNCFRVLPGEELDSNYLYWFLRQRTIFEYANSVASGSAQPDLNHSAFKSIPIAYPKLPIQRKIAAILSAYDDLIENNKRRVALLEKMAEELYREWFVRMRFPGYQMAKFEKGLPVTWSIERIDSIGNIITGKTPSTEIARYYGGPYLFIKTPDMHGNMFVFDTEEKLTEDGIKSQPSQTIPKNSICVSCIGTGGVVSISTSLCQTNQQINSVVLNDCQDLEWAFFTIKNLKETIQLFGATGTTMTNLSKGKFSAIKVLIPNKELRLAFNYLVRPLFSQLQMISIGTRVLQRSRDLLLGRLISGKIPVENLNIQFPPSMSAEIESVPTADNVKDAAYA